MSLDPQQLRTRRDLIASGEVLPPVPTTFDPATLPPPPEPAPEPAPEPTTTTTPPPSPPPPPQPARTGRKAADKPRPDAEQGESTPETSPDGGQESTAG